MHHKTLNFFFTISKSNILISPEFECYSKDTRIEPIKQRELTNSDRSTTLSEFHSFSLYFASYNIIWTTLTLKYFNSNLHQNFTALWQSNQSLMKLNTNQDREQTNLLGSILQNQTFINIIIAKTPKIQEEV